ncbi:MAG: hypothetical protein COT15_01295 [Candidatus Diapherotrites archaeon CG08_land_8_20_14_0_20_34_12]|nr:MAG: hypothetical protein COT15_01295 [Candidatus Diapherotrites archaeon CG08_land_8_20_14_0_20_34_12]
METIQKHKNSFLKTILKQKQREKTNDKEIEKDVQQEKINSEIKSTAIFLALFMSAVLGRVALQFVPSVEPIIPIAILAGLLFGAKEGFSLGFFAYVVSNFFVWGLQGPWTLFQALGAGIPAAGAGLIGKVKQPTKRDFIIMSIAGTIFFEVLMNLFGSLFFYGLFLGALSLPIYFLTSLPFSIAHIAANIGFAGLFSKFLKLKNKVNEDDEIKVLSVSKHTDGSTTSVRLYKFK